jgi:hypothetical protein
MRSNAIASGLRVRVDGSVRTGPDWSLGAPEGWWSGWAELRDLGRLLAHVTKLGIHRR